MGGNANFIHERSRSQLLEILLQRINFRGIYWSVEFVVVRKWRENAECKSTNDISESLPGSRRVCSDEELPLGGTFCYYRYIESKFKHFSQCITVCV